MTVREFIDRIVSQAKKGWQHLTPVYGEWGDGATTACAVTAIASEYPAWQDSVMDEADFIPGCERAIATVAIDAGMTCQEAYDFAKACVDHIPAYFDEDSKHLDEGVYDNYPIASWPDSGRYIGMVIGAELRRVAQCVLSAKKHSTASEDRGSARSAERCAVAENRTMPSPVEWAAEALLTSR